MSYKAEVYNVMLASPSDVNEERNIAREVIHNWNNINAASRKIVLLPLSWEDNSIPTMGGRPQEIINKQILKNADILVGIFWTRIGTPTGKEISGTVEEIEEHIKSDKKTMLYFSQKSVAPDYIDQEQYKAVNKLKKDYQTKGITKDFNSAEDFRTKFQTHLSILLNQSEYLNATETITNKGKEHKNIDLKSSLSAEAQKMLTEASKDPTGKIMKLDYVGGSHFYTNGKQLNEDYSPRTIARCKDAINVLLSSDLISELGYKGNSFQVTRKGFEIADEILSIRDDISKDV